jgi:hypothetical protein
MKDKKLKVPSLRNKKFDEQIAITKAQIDEVGLDYIKKEIAKRISKPLMTKLTAKEKKGLREQSIQSLLNMTDEKRGIIVERDRKNPNRIIVKVTEQGKVRLTNIKIEIEN